MVTSRMVGAGFPGEKRPAVPRAGHRKIGGTDDVTLGTFGDAPSWGDVDRSLKENRQEWPITLILVEITYITHSWNY
jgi:hypothetical protein